MSFLQRGPLSTNSMTLNFTNKSENMQYESDLHFDLTISSWFDIYSFYVLGARKRLQQSGKQEALIKFSNRWHDKTSSSFLKPLNWRYLVRKLYSVHRRRGQRTWMVTFLRRFLTLLNWIAMAFTWFALREF